MGGLAGGKVRAPEAEHLFSRGCTAPGKKQPCGWRNLFYAVCRCSRFFTSFFCAAKVAWGAGYRRLQRAGLAEASG